VLLHDAAAAYEAMRAAALADGVILKPAGPRDSSYRDLAGQRRMRIYWCGRGSCGKAAIVGTSNHGLGKAVDFWLDAAGKVYRWLRAHAHHYGFSHAEGARVGEPWHWVKVGRYAPPKRDPLWYMTARERRLFRELLHLQAIKHPTKAQTKRRKAVWRWLRDQRGRIYTEAHKDRRGWNSPQSKAAHRLSRWRALYKITH
jgi:predicted transcriptional regulator